MVIPKLGFAHAILESDPLGYGQRAIEIGETDLIPNLSNPNCDICFYRVRRALALAYTYDYCQDILIASNKMTLFENALYENIVEIRNWASTLNAKTSNNHGLYEGSGLGIAAISLDGVQINSTIYDASEDLSLAKEVILGVLDGLWDKNGAPFESNFYGMGAPLSAVFAFAEALKRRGDMDIYDYPGLINLSQWFAYELLPQRTTSSTCPHSHKWNNNLNTGYYWSNPWQFLQTAAEYNDGLSQWLFDQTVASMNPDHFKNIIGQSCFGGLFYRHGYTWDGDLILPILKYQPVPGVNPEAILPQSFYFKDRGLVYFRTGWNDINDLLFSFESRLLFSLSGEHFHWHWDDRDKNSYTLYAYGEMFAVDPGRASSSQTYLRFTNNHNYIVIEDLGQSHNDTWTGAGSINDYISDDFIGFVRGDAESAYDELYVIENDPENQYFRIINDPSELTDPAGFLNPVENADRYVQYIKESNGIPFYFILADDIRKDNSLHTYKWLHHTVDGFSASTNGITKHIYKNSNPSKYLDLNIFNPENFSTSSELITIEPDPEITPEAEPTIIQKFWIETEAVNPYFHIMLYAHKDGILAPVTVSRIPLTHGSVGEINWGNYQDYSIFKHDQDINTSLVSTNAKLALLREETTSGNIIRFNITNGSYLTFKGKEILNSYGTETHCSRGEEVLYIYAKTNPPSFFKAFAPGIQTIKLISGEDTTEVENFYRVNDYVYMGPIIENQEWSGSVYISGTVTLTAGKSITVDSGSTIEFAPGATLLSHGEIHAHGSANDSIRITSATSITGYGIRLSKLDTPGGVSSSFAYCSIRGLAIGIEAMNVELEIQNSLIEYCSQGINLLKTTAHIENNLIQYNTVGLYIDGCSPVVVNNDIYHCGSGISLIGVSGSYFENRIVECGDYSRAEYLPTGFYAGAGSLPFLEIINDPGGYAFNVISNNWGIGFKAHVQSTVLAGEEEFPGGNSIFENQSYDAEATVNSTIWAIENYWGTPQPSPGQFHSDDGSRIYYLPFLREPPESSRPHRPQSLPGNINLANKNLSQQDTSFLPFSGGKFLPWRKRLLELFKNRYHSQVIAMGDSLLKKPLIEEEVQLVLLVMHHSSLFHQDSTFIAYLQNFTQSTTGNLQKQLASILLLENYLKYQRLAAARTLIQDIQTRFPESDLEAFALLKAFLIELFYDRNLPVAQQAYLNLKTNFPNHTFTWIAKIQWESLQATGKSAWFTLPKSAAHPHQELSLPQNYMLIQNYPNPFNSTTQIRFSLPSQSRITLKIYNIMGQEVATLIKDKIFLAGNHAIEFDAAELSSGIYFYRIQSDEFISIKKMVLIR